MKICPVGAELFHADKQTDRHDRANSREKRYHSNDKNVTHSSRPYIFVRILSTSLLTCLLYPSMLKKLIPYTVIK
jgi:hypothetical protein